jgi:methylase of polypeptide subunit release factors
MKATSLDFMRDILKESKLYLKANEVIHLDIPHYQELSVKNIYEDALKDEVLI